MAYGNYTLTAALATTPEIPGKTEYAVVFIQAGSSITLLTFYAAEKIGGTYLALYDKSSAAVTQTVAASRAYQLPLELQGCGAFKMVANDVSTVPTVIVSTSQ